MSRELKPCGTSAAYRRHLRYGEPPCEACVDAERARQRDAADARRGGPYELKPCGTAAGANRHRRAGEPICGPCHTAERDYQNTWRRNRQAGRTQTCP